MRFDPLPQLVSSENHALLHFVKCNLLEEQADSASASWKARAFLENRSLEIVPDDHECKDHNSVVVLATLLSGLSSRQTRL